MGAIKNEEFDIQFIERTCKIIEGYKGKFNITLLLNCLLGLIVLPSEFYKRKARNFFEIELNTIKELDSLVENIYFQPTKKNRKTKTFEADALSLKNFIKKIRNGVAHQQIECIENKGKWNKIIIRDYNFGNGNKLELELTWTPRQLKQFALFIAEMYKSQILNLNTKQI